MIFVVVAQQLGTLVAGLVSSLVMRLRWYAGALLLGAAFLIGGILNLVGTPHHGWFAVADLALYLPSAIAGCWLAGLVLGDRLPRSELRSEST